MRIYLSGPMSGRPLNSHDKFAMYATTLRSEGFEVFNPCELESPQHVNYEYTREERIKYMARDFRELETSDLCLMLPRWEESRGAVAERFYAHYLGIPVRNVFGAVIGFSSSFTGGKFIPGEPIPYYPIKSEFMEELRDAAGITTV